MKGNLLGRRFFTRGSTRWGRAGFTSKVANGMPGLSNPHPRRQRLDILRQ